ncbi:MAG TPA: YbhB/YbcL family Raf kinase inhibitor-like protein [Kofleriaceae bacterium]|nr:YbhB/YbcL family Raf kinase inhibitor-like protein [Kofleriaceae bacterium]
MLEKHLASVGRPTRRVRPGLERLAYHCPSLSLAPPLIDVTSSAFLDHHPLPPQYTADGVGLSPPLAWAGVPASARSIAILVEDADSPTAAPLVHAIAWHLSPVLPDLADGELMNRGEHPPLGMSSFARAGWTPPDPPPGAGPHRYGFQVFALDDDPDLGARPRRDALLTALRGHVVARGMIVGTYERAA